MNDMLRPPRPLANKQDTREATSKKPDKAVKAANTMREQKRSTEIVIAQSPVPARDQLWRHAPSMPARRFPSVSQCSTQPSSRSILSPSGDTLATIWTRANSCCAHSDIVGRWAGLARQHEAMRRDRESYPKAKVRASCLPSGGRAPLGASTVATCMPSCSAKGWI